MSSNKPFPSSDLDVFKENSLILDNFVNSQENEYPDRFARKRPTITGIIKEAFNVRTDISNMNETLIGQSRWDEVPKNTSLTLGGDNGALNKQAQALFNRTLMLRTNNREALRRSYAETGYNLVSGSFETGGIINSPTDVLLQESTGKGYSYTGTYPHAVGASEGPESVGWSDRSILLPGAGVIRNNKFSLRDFISIKDFGTDANAFVQAAQEADGRVVIVPIADDDTPLPADYSNTLFEYDGNHPMRMTHTSIPSGISKKSLKAQFSTYHPLSIRSAWHIEAQAQGSGKNGPDSADYGHTIAVHKKGYGGAIDPLPGEIDGLSIMIRQDGPKGQPSGSANSSDASGILVNIQNVEDVGFISAWEASTSNITRGASGISRSIQTQIGVLDMNANGAPSYGYVAISTNGSNSHAFYAGASINSTWTNILHAPGSVTIDAKGNYKAPTIDWPNGSWTIVRQQGPNGSTQMTHRGTGALFLVAQDAGAIQFGTNSAIRLEITSDGHFRPTTTLVYDIGSWSKRIRRLTVGEIDLGTDAIEGSKILTGTGDPNGLIARKVGSLYLRLDGGAGSTLYVKESGSGNTGWVSK